MVISPPEQPTARVKQLKEAFLSLTRRCAVSELLFIQRCISKTNHFLLF